MFVNKKFLFLVYCTIYIVCTIHVYNYVNFIFFCVLFPVGESFFFIETTILSGVHVIQFFLSSFQIYGLYIVFRLISWQFSNKLS